VAPLGETAEKFHADARLSPPGSEFEKRIAKVAEGARFKHALEIYQKQNDPVLAAKEFADSSRATRAASTRPSR